MEFDSSTSESDLGEIEESEENGDDDLSSQEEESNLRPAKKEVGEFLAFKYEGKVFAGRVAQLDEHGPVISAMKPSGKLWKWPVPADIFKYSWADIIGQVNIPVQFSKTREIYSIPE